MTTRASRRLGEVTATSAVDAQWTQVTVNSMMFVTTDKPKVGDFIEFTFTRAPKQYPNVSGQLSVVRTLTTRATMDAQPTRAD